jgi:site-specific recombinase XerD
MNILTNTELFTLRDNIINNSLQQVDNNTLLAFNILRISGLRIQELYNIYTAEHLGASMFLVYTLKGSFVRLIDFGVYTDIILQCIAESRNIFLTQSKVTIERNFYIACNYQQVFVGLKAVETHFFRHCLMKELFSMGNTLTQIKQKFGLSSDRVVEGYINSQIFTK